MQVFREKVCEKKHIAVTFVAMQDEMTFSEAWADFYEWAKATGIFHGMPEKDRKKIYERNAAAKGQRKYPLSNEKIKETLQEFAPGRYEFKETVTLKGQS